MHHDIFSFNLNLSESPENSEDFNIRIMKILDLFGLHSSIKALKNSGLLRGVANLTENDLNRLKEIHDSGLIINLGNILAISSVNINKDEINILKGYQERGIVANTREKLLYMLYCYNSKNTGNSDYDLLLSENNNVGKTSEQQLKKFLSKLFFEYKIGNLKKFSIGIELSNWVLSVEISKTSIAISLGNDKIKREIRKYNGKWKNRCIHFIYEDNETKNNKKIKTKNSETKKIETRDELYESVANNNLLRAFNNFYNLCIRRQFSVFFFNLKDNKSIYNNFDDILNKVKEDFGDCSEVSGVSIEKDSIGLFGNDCNFYIHKKGEGFSVKKIYLNEEDKIEWVSLEEFFNQLKMKVGKL